MRHLDSCKKCKTVLLETLIMEFGEVIEQWSPEWPCQIQDIRASNFIQRSIKSSLIRIYQSLQNHRGHTKFVRRRKLPACDYYIPALNLILEFDESQHFTSPRALTLKNYPKQNKLGYNKREWIERCDKIDRHDNDPPHRDETRAWYDTLRDLLPPNFGMKPTVRIFSKQMIWCQESTLLKAYVKSLTKI